jgi:hypothetical protein
MKDRPPKPFKDHQLPWVIRRFVGGVPYYHVKGDLWSTDLSRAGAVSGRLGLFSGKRAAAYLGGELVMLFSISPPETTRLADADGP